MSKSTVYVLVLTCTLAGIASVTGPAMASEARTPYEESGGQRTPRYAETVAWLTDLAAGSDLLHATNFGTSPQGRTLTLIVADRKGRFAPADHGDRQDRVVVLVQACIHAGESCGKDAGMMLLRDLAAGKDEVAGLLEKVTLVFIPIFNVDGHERFGAFNRINQNGPEEMGWRVTARNQNLNRDYLKADLPEMRAWLHLFHAWSPEFFIDIHSTDGADYQYPITYGLELGGNMDAGLTAWTARYRDAMVDAMEADDYPLAPYVAFRSWHDPSSGLRSGASTPRFSQGYSALQNRPGILVETHMLKPYPVRVESARRLVVHTLRWCGEHASELRRLVSGADAHAASPAFRAAPFPLTFTQTADSVMYSFRGVEYATETSEVTGGQWNRFSDRPVTVETPWFNKVQPNATVELPEFYLVPPEWDVAIERLEAHGVEFSRLAEEREFSIRTWKFTNASWQQRPYEGHHPVSFDAEPWTETRLFPAGTAVVDMNQRAARVIAHLLEPKGPDSLVRWGYFDAIFERVEYVESYVIEEMIPQLLADNPGWAAELEAAKADNPDFAADPWAIRYWFYARTPYYDSRVGIYPVGMVDVRDGSLP